MLVYICMRAQLSVYGYRMLWTDSPLVHAVARCVLVGYDVNNASLKVLLLMSVWT